MDTNQKAKAETKSTYIVEEPITSDRSYVLGEEIELTETEAKSLLAQRAIATPDQASLDAKAAPKTREKEAAEREAAEARSEYDRAQNEASDADAELKAATAKAEEAKRKADAAKARLSKMKAAPRDGPHTWEQDADKLGGKQLSASGGASETPAKAPASGSAMTPSSPTAEALKNQ